ncbi:MAG: bile acid:sodium symporter family protein [Cyclobacteriaceae bacterium]
MIKTVQKYILWLSLPLAVGLIGSLLFGMDEWSKPLGVFTAIFFTIGLGFLTSLRSYQYTFWILTAIVCALIYPNTFLSVGGFDLRSKWLILVVVQLVMFGMGTQMSLRDFAGIRTMGKGVLVGVLCQFTIMPLLGFVLTLIFHFDPEIAAGIVLIGSCSSGLASNVMVYIANANLTLSVTLTAVATLIAPIMTPLLMQLYAGTYIEIDFLSMCIQIIKIVLVPIGAAMIYDALKTGSVQFRNRMIGVGAACAIALLFIVFQINQSSSTMLILELFGFLAGAVVFGIVFYFLTKVFNGLIKLMPLISMFGIVYFTLVTTAASRENILQIGLLLILVAIIHNSLGYVFGYSFSRLLKLDRNSARTIALEVGLQNGGMASGLAGVMGKLATLGLAAAVFSPWMNVSGSLLANYWKRKSDEQAN